MALLRRQLQCRGSEGSSTDRSPSSHTRRGPRVRASAGRGAKASGRWRDRGEGQPLPPGPAPPRRRVMADRLGDVQRRQSGSNIRRGFPRDRRSGIGSGHRTSLIIRTMKARCGGHGTLRSADFGYFYRYRSWPAEAARTHARPESDLRRGSGGVHGRRPSPSQGAINRARCANCGQPRHQTSSWRRAYPRTRSAASGKSFWSPATS